MLEHSDKPREYLETAFASAIERSKPSIEAVAGYLRRNGFEVQIPEIIVRDKIENRRKYADNGDLFYWRKGDKKRLRVEVKHQESYTKPFTGYADFPYNDVLVGRQHLVDRYFDLVHRYIMVSSDHRYGAVISPETKPEWRLREKRKANWGTIETDYYCPVLLTKIVKLVE